MTADPQAPVTLEERIAAHEAAGVMQLSALSDADSAKLSKALVFARRREVALTAEVKALEADLERTTGERAESDARCGIVLTEVDRLRKALTALVKATADPHSASGREYGEAVAVLASITPAQPDEQAVPRCLWCGKEMQVFGGYAVGHLTWRDEDGIKRESGLCENSENPLGTCTQIKEQGPPAQQGPVCRACGCSGAPPDGCGLTPDGLCKYCFLACAQPEPVSDTQVCPRCDGTGTDPRRYPLAGCGLCEDAGYCVPEPDATSTQVCQGCGKKIPPGVVHVRIGTSTSECQVQNK